MELQEDTSFCVRISRIADRYLVFDVNDVLLLRRRRKICAALVGTIPQNPAQNAFLGLPLEVTPDEAKLLVDENAAYIIDEYVQQEVLHSSGGYTGPVQGELLTERRRRPAETGKAAEDTTNSSNQSGARVREPSKMENSQSTAIGEAEHGKTETVDLEAEAWLVTGAASKSLLPSTARIDGFHTGLHPTVAYFHKAGYFMTPGLRFGCDICVYPGDPFRYHSHYLARNVGWEEEISLLDIVGGGRLGTGVKKGYVIASEVPSQGVSERDAVRAMTVEWAGM